MKNKLLLILLMLSGFFSEAQIQAPSIGTLVSLNITQSGARVQFNINRNGSNTNYSVIFSTSPNLNPTAGQTPNGPLVTLFGWQTRFFDLVNLQPNTTYYWRVTASNGLGVTQSVIASFTTLGVPALPEISAVNTSNIKHNGAKINYTLTPNHAQTTSLIRYGLSSDALNNEATGLVAAGAANTAGQITLTELIPLTNYFYQIEATNSVGTVTSPVESFTTLIAPPEVLITAYNFDNSFNNINGNTPFSSNAGVSFTTDRHNNSEGAININNTGSTATIPGLPYGSDSRSISIWVKMNEFNMQPYNFLFSYGSPDVNNSFGGSIGPSLAVALGYNNNYFISSAHTTETWYHYVFTYDGDFAKVYKNGALIGSSANFTAWNTINNNDLFKIGIGVGNELWFNGALDDLKIYNYVLSNGQITNLYTNNTIETVAPTTEASQFFCGEATVADLFAVGTELNWYDQEVGGAILANDHIITSSNTYYVSQTVNGVESPRTAVMVNINPLPSTPSASEQTFCITDEVTFDDIVTTGSNIKWYATSLPTDGDEIPSNSLITSSGVYYFTQTINECESLRGSVTINQSQLISPTFSVANTICAGDALSALPTISNNGITGSWSPALDNTVTTTYTFTPSEEQCAQTQTFTITVNSVTTPTGLNVQTFSEGDTLASIEVSPANNVFWYATENDAMNNTNPLPLSTLLVNNTSYYAVNVEGDCISDVFEVTVSISLGLDNINELDFQFYPNPVIDIINIESDFEVKSIELYNLQGRKVLQSNQKQFSVSELASGMYMIRVEDSENNSITQKLIIK